MSAAESTSETSFPPASLLVLQGADQGARFSLAAKSETSIGRGVHCDIRLHDTEVSRRHALFQYSQNRWWIVDCDSSNGTFVNGDPAEERALNSGDRVRMGGSQLLFSALVPTAEEATRQIELLSLQEDADAGLTSIAGIESHDTFLGFDGLTDPARMLTNLQVLYRVSELAVSAVSSREELLQRVLDLTLKAVGADRGCILLVGTADSSPKAEAFRVRGKSEAEITDAERMPISRSIVDHVLSTRQAVRTSDAQHDTRFLDGQSILRAGIREALCAPLQGHEVLGAIYLDTTSENTNDSEPLFSEDQLRLLAAIGRQAALALENFRYQHALVTAERLAAMGQTIAMLSHHIKNILQGVRGGSYLIERGINQENNQLIRKGWGIVERNQNKIYNLVMDMLSYSKDRQPALEMGGLNKVVAEVCDLMRPRAEELHVVFATQLAEGVPETLFDAEGISRAVLNVITNAIDAVEGRDGGRVVVKTGYRAESDVLFVSVTDNGPGIPAETRESIFDIFESTKGSRGTGLGLAVSQKILREHGGDIRVESAVGRGSRFVLSWQQIHEERSATGEPRGNETGEYDVLPDE